MLEREGARYASLSGSGSTLYGLFASAAEAESAAKRMSAAGHAAVATSTLTRAEYWKAAGQLVSCQLASEEQSIEVFTDNWKLIADNCFSWAVV